MTATQLFLIIIAILSFGGLYIYVYMDYRRHKKPLTTVDPHVSYGLIHHVRVVTLPILKYRIKISVEKGGESLIRRI